MKLSEEAVFGKIKNDNSDGFLSSQVAQTVESAHNVGDVGSIPGSGRVSGEGNGYPYRHSCLENFMDRGAWWATVKGMEKSWT